MKKIVSIFLVLAIIVGMCSVSAFAANDSEEIIPYYSNASYAGTEMQVDNTGEATIVLRCLGYAGTTKIEATTYLEFQTGWTWTRISNGQPNHQWVGSSTSMYFSETYTYQLQMSGTFRATTAFEVTRNGSSEIIIVHSEEFSYSPY